MIDFKIANEEYLNDLMELIRLFENVTHDDVSLSVEYFKSGNTFTVKTEAQKIFNFQKYFYFPYEEYDDLLRKRVEKRYLKMAIYRTLSYILNVTLPYGCLTGIRPTKLYYEIENNNALYKKSAREVFSDDYGVSQEKLSLIEHIVEVQKPLLNTSDSECDVFVFIPFCPTRCAYCSFVSLPIGNRQKLVSEYVDCLVRELKDTKERIKEKNLTVRSVYVGGGTPTSIGAELLDRVLAECHFDAKEFTVEAGRPDTVNKDVVDVMLKHGVTRVSINPQTFNQRTLDLIGRKHTVGGIFDAYMLVKGKFDVNMDFIANLPEETFEDFKFSVDTAKAMSPENITVHTLYMKKGSDLKLAGYENNDCDLAARMVDYAHKTLCAAGYEPYYMYRQKYTSGNLENVGYAKPGKACIYNVDIMEENTSIFANGANGISKKYEREKNLITRCANYKEPLEYVKNIDLMLNRQKIFWEKK